jgi:hypothetical protein
MVGFAPGSNTEGGRSGCDYCLSLRLPGGCWTAHGSGGNGNSMRRSPVAEGGGGRG